MISVLTSSLVDKRKNEQSAFVSGSVRSLVFNLKHCEFIVKDFFECLLKKLSPFSFVFSWSNITPSEIVNILISVFLSLNSLNISSNLS